LEAAIGIEPMNKGFAVSRSSLRKIASVFTRAFSLIFSPSKLPVQNLLYVAIGSDPKIEIAIFANLDP